MYSTVNFNSESKPCVSQVGPTVSLKTVRSTPVLRRRVPALKEECGEERGSGRALRFCPIFRYANHETRVGNKEAKLSGE